MDGNGIKVTTLMDTGCSKPILNKKFYDKHPYLHQFPHYPLQAIGVIVANDGVIKVTEAIQFMVKFHGHVFEFIAYLAGITLQKLLCLYSEMGSLSKFQNILVLSQYV